MDDLNFLHNTYQNKNSENTEVEYDEMEQFGLNPKILIVEDDTVLGLSIKKYLNGLIIFQFLDTSLNGNVNHVVKNQQWPYLG